MPSLEDRLFYRLEANLNHRDEIIETYGHRIDMMRDYSFKHDITVQLAAALNICRKYRNPESEEITADDIGAYNLMHSSDNVSAYESTHGIKTFAFHITLEERNKDILMQKLSFPCWVGAVALTKSNFELFKFAPLYFNIFGLVVSGGRNNQYKTFQHEALHLDRRRYSAHFSGLAASDMNPHYPAGLWRAKLQAHLMDDVFSYMQAGEEEKALEEKMRGDYWDYYFEGIVDRCFIKLKDEERHAKKKELGLILAPVKAQIRHAVAASFRLKARLGADVLTPLFFALGPNEEEVKKGILYGPLSDIEAWAVLLNSGRITPEKIRQQLQKRGYCRDTVIFSCLQKHS